MKLSGARILINFVFTIISRVVVSRMTIRLTAALLILAFLSPAVTLYRAAEITAQTKRTLRQPAPITAPPEPYIFSSRRFSPSAALPAFETAAGLVSGGYSTVAAFIKGAETPEGLGAATPPPTFVERISGQLSLLFFASGGTAAGKKENNTNEGTSPQAVLPTCTSTAFDFDGDCLADFGRWQSSSFQYKVHNSSSDTYTTLNLGSSASKIAPADFDGDGKFDMAVFSAGSWTVRKSSTGTDWNVSWGTTSDLPVAADYDGDGLADFAVYRPSITSFLVLTSSSNYLSYTTTSFGASGDVIVPGDFDGDGKADAAVFRPSTGYWHYQPSSGGSVVSNSWGVSTDIPSPGDFDGDGMTDCAVYRPSVGTWYVLKSSGGSPNYTQTAWGNLGDQPVPADFDGDGTTDMAIYRPTTGMWWVLNSTGGSPGYLGFSLGTSADTAVPSAYLKQAGAELTADQLAPVRLAPINSTGGTDYYSRNSSWGAGLVSLPGRSGLSLNLGIGYNSLVWTKIGSTMAFDIDKSDVAPGFSFGFPKIEPTYINSQTSILSYLMITPSGARTEFRQTAASDTYETADSGYAQIKVNNPGSANSPTPVEDITLTVTGTDGTQMSYSWIVNAYRCTQIKDRNGNYITINHNVYGQLASVTDTLGRTVTINYDGNNRLSSITQNWQTQNGSSSTTTTHTWVSFSYASKTISTDFDGSLALYGPANNTSITVLDKVTYADGSYTKFDYNGYGQVYKVSSYAENDNLLNYVWRDIQSPGADEPDCPRFTETRTFAANFNGGSEVVMKNTFATGVSYTLPDSSTASGARIEIKSPDSTGATDALVTKIYSASSGWAESLPVLTEDYATENSTPAKKRWTWTSYTQDDTGLAYIKNPRVVETKVGDDTSTRRTTIDYLLQESSNESQYGLVSAVQVYDTNQSTVMKTQTTSYNLSSNYTSRRIIGLPSEVKLYSGTSSGTLVSKVSYAYDENGYGGTGQSVTATQHDGTNYGTGFGYRGNLTSTTRWDANNSTNSSLAVSSQVKYNIAGSPISQTDPRGRVSSFSYTDSWNDTVSRNATFAYPTTVTDPGGYSSTIKYRYDIGANVWARSPTPLGTGNQHGKTTSRIYSDTTGRIEQEKIENSGAYTRYIYPNDGASVNTYTTVVDAGNDGAGTSDEVLTETLLDGAGRVRRTRTENPDGTGIYTGRLIEYNILGQVKRSSVPTKINSSWNPVDEDYRGMNGNDYIWLWKSFEYDWKGRVTKETNTDTSDRLYSYTGCGCAGELVTTIKGEVTTAMDTAGTTQTTKRRTQKIYQDILGRTEKTEIWDLDGAGSAPYSTIVNTYNGRDQVTSVKEYAGSSSSLTNQETTMTYDGHGRLSSRHLPEQFDANNTATYTTYTYNADDTVATMTDPRGAVTTYAYGYADDAGSTEYRALLTKVGYSVPQNSGIPDPADVSFTYDAAGNRTYMSDASGNLTYSYDELSRLKVETKNFTGTLSEAPQGGYLLKYDYHLTGGLKSVGSWFGSSDTSPVITTYASDKIGRVTAIGGDNFFNATTEVTSFASNISHRAFGAVKSMTYDTADPTQISLDYNTRLQPISYEAESNANTADTQNVTYSYFNDGSVKEVVDSVDGKFSQFYDYDFAGRLKRNEFGGTQGVDKPYKQTLGYDAFNHITSRSTETWGTERNFTATYTNNRKTSGGYQSSVDTFDVAGNITQNIIYDGLLDNIRKWKFDAAGRMTEWEETLPDISSHRDWWDTLTFDGDGRTAKRIKRNRHRINGNTSWYEETEYTIYSSVTGQKITTLATDGEKRQSFVYMGSSVIGEQNYLNNNIWFNFKYNTPVTGSIEETDTDGLITPNGVGREDFAALGEVIPPEEEEISTPNYSKGGSTTNPESGCQLNYAPVFCSQLKGYVRSRGYSILGGVIVGVASIWRYDRYSVYDNESDEGVARQDAGENFAAVKNLLIFYDRSWYIGHLNFVELPGALRIQNNKYISPRRVLGEFLDNNPNCLKVINEIGKKLGLQDFKTTLFNTVMLASTFDEIGTTIGQMPVFGKESGNVTNPKQTFFDFLTERYSKTGVTIYGVTTYGEEGPIIWISHLGMNATTKVDKTTAGEVIFHESIHRYLYDVGLNSHTDIVKTLGIDLLDWEYKSDEGTKERENEENLRASESLSAWIARGCRNISKK